MFTRVAHVCLGVKDVDRSVAYYEKLGLTVRFRFDRKGARFGAYMEVAPGSYVEMFQDPNMGPVVNNGILHFCLETDDIDAVVARLTELGVPVTPKKLGCDNSWQAWLEDPDGNKIEIHQYTPTSLQFMGGTVEADW